MQAQPRQSEDIEPAPAIRVAPDDRPYLRPIETSGIDFAFWGVLLALVLAAGAGGFYYLQKYRSPVSAPPLPRSTAPPALHADTAAAPAVRRLPEPRDAQSLPDLADSDATVWTALTTLFNFKLLNQLAYSDRIIRRIVATVDALPRKSAPVRMMPVKPVPGKLRIDRSGITHVIARENSARYRAYVQLALSVNAGKLVDAYFRFYPLFQKAYADLGYPNDYFNDRLMAAIDDLLAAPTPSEPIRLAQPKVLYQFASEDLEARSSAGQKIMMRIGNANEARIKARLREIRAEIARRAAKG
ncbi:MAG TPA: DUF3014 domain-containing protein [Burkholderiales bacterium]|nr:DUF3014 domain-containing protein [Burkholderiales bacterium]